MKARQDTCAAPGPASSRVCDAVAVGAGDDRRDGHAHRLRRPRRRPRSPAAAGRDPDPGPGLPDLGDRATCRNPPRTSSTSASCSPPASAWASPPPPTSTWCSATAPANAARWPTRSPATKPTRASGSSSTPGSRLPVRFRAAYVADDEIDELVTRCATWARPGDVIDLAQRRDDRRPATTTRTTTAPRVPRWGCGRDAHPRPHPTPEYRAAMTVIVGACTLAALGSVIPAVEYADQRRDGRARHPRRCSWSCCGCWCGSCANASRTPPTPAPPPPGAPPTSAPHDRPAGLLRGCRDVGRHRLGRRDLAQNHGVPRPRRRCRLAVVLARLVRRGRHRRRAG